MLKLVNVLIGAGLVLGMSAATAQNVDSDKDRAQGQEQVMRNKEQGTSQTTGAQSNTMQRSWNEAGERQIGLEQYMAEQKQCQGVAADARRDCMELAKVRYEGWAIMQCELVAGVSKQRCYQNIQAAVLGHRATSPSTPETGAVRRGEDEDKPGRQ